MQSLWVPAIHAQLAMDRKNPSSALKVPQGRCRYNLYAVCGFFRKTGQASYK